MSEFRARASPPAQFASRIQLAVTALAGDAARDVDGRDGRRADGARGVRRGLTGALRRHRQPAAQQGPPADRKRFAGRRSRQGDRGHRLLRRQRDAGEPRPVHLHRQPAGPDAADRQAGEGRDVRPAAAVAAHRQPSARARRASEQRQLAADLQEPGPDRPGAQTAWHRAAHRRRDRGGDRGVRGRHGGPCGTETGGPAHRGRRTGGAHRRPAPDPGARQRRTRPSHTGFQHDAARRSPSRGRARRDWSPTRATSCARR